MPNYRSRRDFCPQRGVAADLTGRHRPRRLVVAHDAARFRKRRAHQALERIDFVVNGLDRRANPSLVFFGFVRIERFQGVIKEDATWLFPQVKPDKTQSTTPFLQRWIPRPIVQRRLNMAVKKRHA
jgi:hypothetical protein